MITNLRMDLFEALVPTAAAIVATPDTRNQEQNGCLWRAWCNDALIFLSMKQREEKHY